MRTTRGEQPKVVAVDRVKDNVLVYFSDGTSSLFQGEFLYLNRNSNGNGPAFEDPSFKEEET